MHRELGINDEKSCCDGKEGAAYYSCLDCMKYKIDDEKAIFLMETKDGILLKPLNSFWDWIGTGRNEDNAEEVHKELYRLRHEEDE